MQQLHKLHPCPGFRIREQTSNSLVLRSVLSFTLTWHANLSSFRFRLLYMYTCIWAACHLKLGKGLLCVRYGPAMPEADMGGIRILISHSEWRRLHLKFNACARACVFACVHVSVWTDQVFFVLFDLILYVPSLSVLILVPQAAQPRLTIITYLHHYHQKYIENKKYLCSCKNGRSLEPTSRVAEKNHTQKL